MARDSFSSYHPIVNFTYFTLVILFAMVLMHPAALGISFLCAFFYASYLNGIKWLKRSLLYMLPMLLFTGLINPAFNHEGATILAYFPNGNPLTLESIAYGISAAFMFVSVICWFSCYNKIMSSDKFIYLFGKIIPSLSLILSMVLRFVPKFKSQLEAVSNAQKCIGRDISSGGFFLRIRHGLRILSIMVTWSLENAVETADSMKSRGYGLSGRTAFSVFNFDSRDRLALGAIIFAGLYVLAGGLWGALYYRYYPTIKYGALNMYNISVFAAYAALCLIPLAINLWEDRKWKYLQSNI